MAVTQYDYIGKGRLSLRKKGASAPFVPVGNASKVTFTVDEDKKENKDYESSGGGNRKTVSLIKSVSLSLTTTNLSPENLMIAWRASATNESSTTAVTDEKHTAYQGGITLMDFLPNAEKALTVADATGTTTYKENEDYTRTPGGIEVLSGGKMVDGTEFTFGYTPVASVVLQALTNSASEYEIQMELVNQAMDDQVTVIEVFRASFSPSGTDLIGDDFGELKLDADVLKDATVVGSGLSKFFRTRMAKAA
jgi:hypothetical protein